MKTILIAGGSGNIGSHLIPILQKSGHRVIVFSRNPQRHQSNEQVTYARWEPDNLAYDKDAIVQADVVINLAGAGIADKRWSEKRKAVILRSRIQSCNTLIKALEETPNRIQSVISASAIGFYGEGGETTGFKESDPAGKGFLADVCQQWEKAIHPAENFGKRLVVLRIGIVLDKHSGAYKEFSTPLKFRVGTILGSGTQMMSWIHIDDLCRIIAKAVDDEDMKGTFNCCAPQPVSNKVLVATMGRERYGRGFIQMKIPAFLLKLIFGQMAEEAILQSAVVSCDKLLETGFEFQYNRIEEAVSFTCSRPIGQDSVNE